MKALRVRGFTLVEVLVAGAVFTLSMLAVLPLFVLTANETAKARGITGAQLTAIEVIERLRGEIHWDSGTLASPTLAATDFWNADILPHGAPYTSPTFKVQRQEAEYEVSYELTAAPAGQDCSGTTISAGLADVPAGSRCARITVDWPREGGKTGRFEMRTLLLGAR